MKISENWLREWANPELNSDDLVSQLTMAGLEVDSISPASPALEKVVVAEVVSCEQHPDADRLNLCKVNDGSTNLVQVICGAANVKQGIKVVFAQVGADLAGFKIKKAKLRGVESFGMICSEQELKLSDSSDGIMELSTDAPIGMSISEYLQLNDNLIEIDLTPNRGDCLSLAGVAREVIANNDVEATPVIVNEVDNTIDDVFDVQLINQQACPHYVCRIVKNINATAETPLWMKEKLRRSDLRPISPVVDITNYVMMELGQPMHGFDLDKLSGGIQVRNATENEKISLLDGSEVECREDTLVIADHEKSVAIAGIMGGQDSSVQNDTKNILFEAAFFAPALIAGKARSYGLHTDSSHRFERGVDPELQVKAVHRATELLLDICGGVAGPITEQVSSDNMPKQPEVLLRHSRIERLLGIKVSVEQITKILHKLEMQVIEKNGDWKVIAPSYRFDINIEADLIEEIGRIIGYNNIPSTKEAAHVTMESFSEKKVPVNRLRETLVARGYFEAVTYSFVSPELQNILDPKQSTLSLSNPISSDMSEMRTLLLPGLIQAAKRNLNRQQSRVRLFETGLCFIPEDNTLTQKNHIAALITGHSNNENWSENGSLVNFFDIKGDIQSLIPIALRSHVEFKVSRNVTLHPGQAADIYISGVYAGYIGAIHPTVLKQLDVDQKVYVFEVELDRLLDSELPEFTELSKYPSIRRDLALIVDEQVTAQELINAVKNIQDQKISKIIQDVFVFDVYTGKEVIKSRKSVALGLILQEFSRTLTDKEVDAAVSTVLEILEKECKAVLR